MRKKIFAVVSALGWASMGWMAHGFFNDQNDTVTTPDQAVATTPAVRGASPAQADGSVVLATVPKAEAIGLMNIGAQKGAALTSISDEQSLCAVVKDNALKTNPSAEFKDCANRTLHYDAAFLQAGAVFGAELNNMKGGDLCAVYKIASTRAAMKYTLEAGQAIPDHDTTMANVNRILDGCLSDGEYGAANAAWNSYVNQAVILPFYQKQDVPQPASAPAPQAPTSMMGG
jgi:hypothetical protein